MLDPNGYMSDVDFYNYQLQDLKSTYAKLLYEYTISRGSSSHYMEDELKLRLDKVLLEIKNVQDNLERIKMKKFTE